MDDPEEPCDRIPEVCTCTRCRMLRNYEEATAEKIVLGMDYGKGPDRSSFESAPSKLDVIQAWLERIDAKLDTLIAALAEEPDQEAELPSRSLDGEPAGGERDQTQGLG